MREITRDGKVLARHITAADFKNGLNFFSDDSDFIQVGVWNNYERAKKLQAHIHNKAHKPADRTHEALYLIQGKIEAAIYDLDGVYVDRLEIHQGEILVLLECGHGYTILEDGTTVLEVKNGPYLGAEADRRRI